MTLSLDSPADVARFSTYLGSLAPGASFEATVGPVQINEIPNNQYGYSVGLSVLSDTFTGDSERSFAIVWERGTNHWFTATLVPDAEWVFLRDRVVFPFNEQRTFQVHRRNGAFEFWFSGINFFSAPDPGGAFHVRARVVGVKADITYMQ